MIKRLEALLDKVVSTNIMKPKTYIHPKLQSVIETISFKPKNITILGSFGVRSQLYPSDIDCFEVVKENKLINIYNKFKSIINNLTNNSNIYIGDIKCGVYEPLRIIDETAFIVNNKVYRYDYNKSIKKLHQLYDDGLINLKEYKKGRELLVPNPNEEQLGKIKKDLRLHIIRWKPTDVMRGYIVMRDNTKYHFTDALASPSLFKMDIIYYLDNKFYDITTIYDIRDNNGNKTKMVYYDVRNTLISDIKMYRSKKDYFKVMKRYLSLLKYDYKFRNKTMNKSKIIVLTKVLNSQLGQLYQVKTMVDTLIYLIDNHHHLNKDRIRKNVGIVIDRLSYLYGTRYIGKERRIIANLMSILTEKSVGSIGNHLISIYEDLETILNEKSKPFVASISF